MTITLQQLQALAASQNIAIMLTPDGKVQTTEEGIMGWTSCSLPEFEALAAPFMSGIEGAVLSAPGYETLACILAEAFDQAAGGKGKERHARGQPFHAQPMQVGADHFGIGGLLFQAFKKSDEAQRLPHGAAIRELLGAINYLAGAVLYLKRHQPVAANDNSAVTAANG